MIRLSSLLVLSFVVISCSGRQGSKGDPEVRESAVQGRFQLISRRCSSIREVQDGLNFRRGDSVFFHFDHLGRYTIDILLRGQTDVQQGSYRAYGTTLLMTDDGQPYERAVTVEPSPRGNYLTLISQDFERGYCPPGDKVISILQRIRH